MERLDDSKDVLLREMPSVLMIELTNLCQLRCITCPREYSMVKEYAELGNMGIDKFKTLVDRYIAHCKTLSLTGGGETFLYPDLGEAVEYVLLKNENTEIFMSTNAAVRDAARIFERVAGKITVLQISIDGTGEVYEKIRQKAKYSQFKDNVKAIASISRNTKTSLMFNMVLIKDNIDEIIPVLEFARTLGIHHVNVTPINLVSHDWEASYYDYFRSAIVKETVERAREFAKGEGIEFTYYDLNKPIGFRDCPFLWNSFYITWDGFLVPCCAKPLPKLLNFGNVLENNLLDCINNPVFAEFRRLSRQNKAPAFCNKCHLL